MPRPVADAVNAPLLDALPIVTAPPAIEAMISRAVIVPSRLTGLSALRLVRADVVPTGAHPTGMVPAATIEAVIGISAGASRPEYKTSDNHEDCEPLFQHELLPST